MLQGLGVGVLGFRAGLLEDSKQTVLGWELQGLGFRVLGFRGLGFRGLGFGGLGFRVWGFRV